jgi:hypothetical protein
VQLADAVQQHKAAARRGDVRCVLVATRGKAYIMRQSSGVCCLQQTITPTDCKQLRCPLHAATCTNSPNPSIYPDPHCCPRRLAATAAVPPSFLANLLSSNGRSSEPTGLSLQLWGALLAALQGLARWIPAVLDQQLAPVLLDVLLEGQAGETWSSHHETHS